MPVTCLLQREMRGGQRRGIGEEEQNELNYLHLIIF